MQVLGEHDSSVKNMLDTFGVYLQPSAFRKDVKPLLKEACSRIFGSASGLVDMMVQHFPSSKAGSAIKASPAAPSNSCDNTASLVPHKFMWNEQLAICLCLF